MSATIRKKRAARQKRFFQEGRRRIKKRLANTPGPERPVPMMTATNIHYEQANRVRGLSAGGIGAIFLMAQKIELDKEIDRTLHLLKRHLPYHESDHVLNIAFNILAGGKRIEHLELRRNDEVYLDALGAERIPDPTTAGDFCRRFSSEADVLTLMNAINESRLRVWAQQPDEFLDEAIVDADGTIVETDAECKEGVDIDHDGRWGYHLLLVSLANTAEPLFLLNRSGNRPSQERAGEYLDKAVALCIRAGFRKILLRGDTRIAENKDLDPWDEQILPREGTTIAETANLDSWDDAENIRFIFGYAAYDVLKARADELPAEAYSFLERPPRYAIKTTPRQQPERVKPEIVRERGFKTIHLLEEMIAEFDYQPVACKKSYRMIVLRKRLATDQGQMRLFEEYRYFFYITNDRDMSAEDVVFSANDRCNQENLDRPAQERRACTDDAGRRLGEQLGVYGDGQLGLEPEGLERPAGARITATRSEAQGRETNPVADGVRDVLRGFHPDAVSDRAGWTTVDLPDAVLEPVARRFPTIGRAAARVLAVLKDQSPKSGSGCPDP